MKPIKFLFLILFLSACGSDEIPFFAPNDDWSGHFDAPKIQDVATADCRFTNPRQLVSSGTLLDVWDLSYTSWEYINGQGLREITIRSFAAKPSAISANLPALVFAHGLGGSAGTEDATYYAALLNAFVVSYSGPGAGDPTVPASVSEGLPHTQGNGYRLFDTLESVKGSWFWAHSIAAMRALTCLENRNEVDSTRLGMAGGSGGGIATLVSASVDNRILAALSISSSLALDRAVLSANAWEHDLLAAAGLNTASNEWINLQSLVGSDALLPSSSSAIMMFNGSVDEYFPLQAHMQSYDSISGSDKRLSFAANYDHGCTAVLGTGSDSATDIVARASLRMVGAMDAWFGHWFGNDQDFTVLPQEPGLVLTGVGSLTAVQTTVDMPNNLNVEEVRLWWSGDNGLSFSSVLLNAESPGNYTGTVAVARQNIHAAFVDVLYNNGSLLAIKRLSLSSRVDLASGFVQTLRRINGCQP